MESWESIVRFLNPALAYWQSGRYGPKAMSSDKGWNANKANANFIRVEEKNEGKEFVILEEKVLEAIARFWMTLPPEIDRGILRFYIDGDNTSFIEGVVRKIL